MWDSESMQQVACPATPAPPTAHHTLVETACSPSLLSACLSVYPRPHFFIFIRPLIPFASSSPPISHFFSHSRYLRTSLFSLSLNIPLFFPSFQPFLSSFMTHPVLSASSLIPSYSPTRLSLFGNNLNISQSSLPIFVFPGN